MSANPELRGERLNAHCPYDEATLRQSTTHPERAICPVCFTSLLKPVGADEQATTPPGIMSAAVEGVALLPCPFCGWSAGNSVMDSGDEPYWVECADCYAQSGVAETRDAAIAAWNTRTTPPARSYADEDVARIIDPNAYRTVEDYLADTAEWVERCSAAANNGFDYRAMARGLAEDNYNGAEHGRQIALAKAAAIRLLSQGGKA